MSSLSCYRIINSVRLWIIPAVMDSWQEVVLQIGGLGKKLAAPLWKKKN